MIPALGMSALETAAGRPFGWDPPVAVEPGTSDPMQAFEDILLPALQNPPCRVAFSGGRDSSLLLAAAVRAARRHGCPLPLAVTARYREAQAEERRWQDLVLDHLGVEAHVLEVDDEHDFVGPVATAQLRRHGPVFPANAHTSVSLLGETAGGTLFLGVGGDELLSSKRWSHLNGVLAGRERLRPLDPARFVLASSPAVVQAMFGSRLPAPSWLRPSASRRERRLDRLPAEPLRYDRTVRLAARSRVLTVGLSGLQRVGETNGVTIGAPLLDERFVGALARAGGARGWPNRSSVMRFLAQDLLPDALLARGDKAAFTTSFFNEHTRRFAEEWSGSGVDTDLVDPELLRREWLSPEPDSRSALLLQIAWLHDHAASPAPPAEHVLGT